MMFRSVTSRLVLFYCLLLVVLGGAFLGFTVISFSYFAQETISSNLTNRAGEIWNLSENLVDQPERLADLMSRRFSPEPLDRFIRIRVRGTVIYQSGEPENRGFHPFEIPLTEPSPSTRRIRDILLYTGAFSSSNGSSAIVETGQTDHFARAVQARLCPGKWHRGQGGPLDKPCSSEVVHADISPYSPTFSQLDHRALLGLWGRLSFRLAGR